MTDAKLRANAILGAIVDQAPRNMELRPDGTEDRLAAAYVEGVRAAWEAARAVLYGERHPTGTNPLAAVESPEDAAQRRADTERAWLEQTIHDIGAATDRARQVDSASVPVATIDALLRRPR